MAHRENSNPSLAAPNGRPETHNGLTPLASGHGAYPAGNGVAEAPACLTAAPTPAGLWHAFRRRWLVALLAATVGTLAAVAAALELVPGHYTAKAIVTVEAPAALPELGETTLDLRTYRDNQAGILKSDPVLREALNRPDVKTLPAVRGHVENNVDSLNWLRTGLKVDFDAPSLMGVTMRGEDPEELRVLVNGVVRSYIELARKIDKDRCEEAKQRLRQQMNGYRAELEAKVNLRNDALDRLGIPRPEAARLRLEQSGRELEQVRKTYNELCFEQSKAEAKLRGTEASRDRLLTGAVPQAALAAALKDDEVSKKFAEELARVEALKRVLVNSGNRSSPAVQQQLADLDRESSQVLRGLEQYRQARAPDVRKQLAQERDLELTDLRLQVQALEEQKDQVLKTLAKLEQDVNRLTSPPANPELAALDREIKAKEDSLQQMQIRQTTLEMAPLGANVSLLQEADVPAKMDRSRQFKVAGVAAAGAFGLLLLGVSLLEFRSRKINGPDEVTRGLGLGLVGTLPRVPERLRRPGAAVTPKDRQWQELLAESVDAVRTMLLHAARGEGLQVVMVASAAPGEGKTSLASQLAVSLARAWKKTLVVDGDLRNPSMHKLFGQPQEPGLSEVLRGEVHLADAVRPTSVSRLWVMPAGQWDSHAVQALAQDGVRALFAELKEQYDFVVVDSCPLLPVADSMQLAQHVDAALFAVLRDVSRAPLVHAARRRLETLGVRCLGAVVLGATDAGEGYPYPAVKRK